MTAKATEACFGVFRPVVVKTANRLEHLEQAFLFWKSGEVS
jgi:hypothetical protein